MKSLYLLLLSLACASSCLAQENGNLLNAGQVTPVPDSSSTALLLGSALVSSLLVGRKLIKK
jgi:hypothetical protein